MCYMLCCVSVGPDPPWADSMACFCVVCVVLESVIFCHLFTSGGVTVKGGGFISAFGVVQVLRAFSLVKLHF